MSRPTMLQMAIGAVKDQASVGLAQVFAGTSSHLDVAILKATSHDEVPVDDRHVNEVLFLAACSSDHAAACVRALSRRLSRTGSWVVAIKSLSLLSRAISGGGPFFLREVHAASRRGIRLLDPSCFGHDAFPSTPRELAAFVRSFALYLVERLDCALAGKLDPACLPGMRIPAVLDRVTAWQRALDRVIATRPAGAALVHRLVQIALYSVVRESFDLYRGVSEGLVLVLGSFFRLQPWICMRTYRACAKAAQQFEKLEAFYILCIRIGVGRGKEYPAVQKISSTNLESFGEFLQVNEATAAMATSSTFRKRRDPRSLFRRDTTEETHKFSPAAMPKRGSRTDFANNKEESEHDDRKNTIVSEPPPANHRNVSTSGADDEWERLLAETATAILNRRSCHSFPEPSEPTALETFSCGGTSLSVPEQRYVNPFLQPDEAGVFTAAQAFWSATTSVPPPSALQTGEPAAMQQLRQQEQQRRGCSSTAWSSKGMCRHDLLL